MNNYPKHIKRKKDQEKQKKLVVTVTKTVVYKRTMVIESLHTLVAIVAMACTLRSEIFAMNAHIVQVKLLIH